MHIHRVEDESGDLVDVIPFCSDFCHRTFCDQSEEYDYEGWDGCHEVSEGMEWTECEQCGDLV